MDEGIIQFLKEYGVYIAFPVVVAGITQSLKVGFKKFFRNHHIGVRLVHFIPIILGLGGGLLLPEDSIATQLLYGGALGTFSSLIYKTITKTFARKVKLLEKINQAEKKNKGDTYEF